MSLLVFHFGRRKVLKSACYLVFRPDAKICLDRIVPRVETRVDTNFGLNRSNFFRHVQNFGSRTTFFDLGENLYGPVFRPVEQRGAIKFFVPSPGNIFSARR